MTLNTQWTLGQVDKFLEAQNLDDIEDACYYLDVIVGGGIVLQ